MESEIKVAIKEGKSIFVFGASESGKNIAHDIRDYSSSAKIAFIDNDPNKWEKNEHDIEVKSVESAVSELKSSDTVVVLTSTQYLEEMKEQLYRIGVPDRRIIKTYEVLYHESSAIIRKRTPRNTMNFVVDITEHCNLNCKCCDHFSPLSEEYDMPIEEYEKDMRRMKEIFSDKVEVICIEGGEPLLNKNIISYISLAADIFPKAEIQIYTNGLLLSKMNISFWKICHEKRVVIEITKYPIGVNYKEIESIAEENRVTVCYYDHGFEVKNSMHKPIDISGSQNKYESFHRCYMANLDCVDLKHGRLYPCTFAANIHIFNKYFDKNLELDAKDYVDIYSDVTADEIFDRLCNPIPACKYCKVKEWTYFNEWGQSQKAIQEWT